MKPEMTYLPIPQQIQKRAGMFRFPDRKIRILLRQVQPGDEQRLLAALRGSARALVLVSEPGLADLVLQCDERLDLPAEIRKEVLGEAYRLQVSPNQVVISARAPAGLFYGIQTLLQALRQTRALPAALIVDWPSTPMRGIHLPLGVSGHTLAALKDLIATLASCKMNTMVFQYDDRFTFESHPVLASKIAFTKDEIRDLIAFANDRYIHIIPLLDSLGHASAYLSHPEYKHLRETDIWEMCPSNPKTLAFMKQLWTEVLEVHAGCRFAHITGDEVFRQGFCPQCRPYADSGRLSELFCGYYRQLCGWVLEQGRRPIMWSDMLLHHPERIDWLPRELVVHDWSYWNVRGMHSQRWQYTLLFGLGAITREMLPTLPEDVRKNYLRYMVHPSGRGFQPFPYGRFFQDRGFEVIGGPSINGEYGLLPVSPFADRINNAKYFAQAVHRDGALGLINTFWSARGVFGSMQGILSAATYSWRYHKETESDLLATVQRLYLGGDAGHLPRLAQAMDAVSVQPTGYVSGTKKIPTVSRMDLQAVIRRPAPDRGMRHFQGMVSLNAAMAVQAKNLQETCMAIDRLILGRGQDVPLDIRGAANGTLTKFLHIPGRGLEDMGHGRKEAYGVPFKIIDPQSNRGQAVICAYSKQTSDRPRQVTIPVQGRFTRLFFLHSSAYARAGTQVAVYRVHRADGSHADMDVVVQANIGDWYGSRPPLLTQAAVEAWRGHLLFDGGSPLHAFMAWWVNPMPDVPLQSVEVIAGPGDKSGYGVLIAVTGRKREASSAARGKAQGLMKRLAAFEIAMGRLMAAGEKCYGATMPQMAAHAAADQLLSINWPATLAAYRAKLELFAAAKGSG